MLKLFLTKCFNYIVLVPSLFLYIKVAKVYSERIEKLSRKISNKIPFYKTILLKKDIKKILNGSELGEAYNIIIKDKQIIQSGSLDDILQILHNSISLKHSLASTYLEIANFILNMGRPEIAQTYFKLSLEASLIPSTYSLYLQCLLLSPSCTDEMMQPIAYKYNELFLDGIQKYTNHENELVLNKKLNIGYICHFFHNSVSQSLLTPLLKAHNRERIKVFCYSDTEQNEVPENIKDIADVWLDTKKLDDAELATIIINDKIDILIELNGHCIVNRYGVIARKPAPIQVSYYNHCGTTGISTIDYNLIGDEVILDKIHPHYTESIYYLKGVTGIAIFPDNFPDCAPPPVLEKKHITFGSFGAAHKVNNEVVKLWCKVLKAVPNAKFYMKAGALSHTSYLNAYKKMFKDECIDLKRIRFEGHSEHKVMLQCYSDVDIALDTFPHAAGTTTMEATWQGVPVITLSGKRHCSQNGMNILTSINHPELVAYSEKEFIKKSIELANDTPRLIKYRQQLRDDFRNSPRGDAKTFATKLEDAYIDMWQIYCNSISSRKEDRVEAS